LAAVLRLVVDQRRDAVVGRDREKFRLELLALADVHRNDLVLEPRFLEEHRDLVAIRRGPIMQLDHGKSSCCRHGRACPGHPDKVGTDALLSEMRGTGPRMTRGYVGAGQCHTYAVPGHAKSGADVFLKGRQERSTLSHNGSINQSKRIYSGR